MKHEDLVAIAKILQVLVNKVEALEKRVSQLEQELQEQPKSKPSFWDFFSNL